MQKYFTWIALQIGQQTIVTALYVEYAGMLESYDTTSYKSGRSLHLHQEIDRYMEDSVEELEKEIEEEMRMQGTE